MKDKTTIGGAAGSELLQGPLIPLGKVEPFESRRPPEERLSQFVLERSSKHQ